MINVQSILQLQQKSVVDWHYQMILTQTEEPWNIIEEITKWNFLLWHQEDIARVMDIDPLLIVEAKRNIDRYNQLRNNAIEKIDEWILSVLQSSKLSLITDMHSETPGMMIDRLSIMALKRYHMFEETKRTDILSGHKEQCMRRVGILDEQIADLANCLINVLALLESGQLHFKVYRQFKMYNDPNTNPELYKRAQQQAKYEA